MRKTQPSLAVLLALLLAVRRPLAAVQTLLGLRRHLHGSAE